MELIKLIAILSTGACIGILAIVAVLVAVAWHSRPLEQRDAASPNPRHDAPKPKGRLP